MTLVLSKRLIDEIRLRGERAYPEETAGLMLGKIDDGDVRRVERIMGLVNRSEAEARTHRYRLEPRDLMAAEDQAEQAGQVILGVYHSHPDHPPAPSAFDLEQALPFYTYLITPVDSGAAGESRAWRLAEDRSRFDEETVHWLPEL